MRRIQNPDVAGKEARTSLGLVRFGRDGIAEVENEMAELLLSVPGFSEIRAEAQVEKNTSQPVKGDESAGWAVLSIAQLRAVAEKHGVTVPRGARKVDIISLIETEKAKEPQ